MIARKTLVVGLLLFGLGMVRLAEAQDAGPVTEQNVTQRISTAKTAADHQALAAYFKAQAATAAQKVKDHQAMLASFKKIGGKPGQVWESHCQSLIKTYGTQAKDYEKLADEQDTLAKEAGGK